MFLAGYVPPEQQQKLIVAVPSIGGSDFPWEVVVALIATLGTLGAAWLTVRHRR